MHQVCVLHRAFHRDFQRYSKDLSGGRGVPYVSMAGFPYSCLPIFGTLAGPRNEGIAIFLMDLPIVTQLMGQTLKLEE